MPPNARSKCTVRPLFCQRWPCQLATEKELSDFLKSVEKRAFKRAAYHVRNDESALDIVQDSMMKLAEHYGHKPVEELPMLFQRILSNSTLDWFRRQKTRNALFSSLTRRIVFFNLAALIVLVGGIMYLNQFREGLIDARVESLLTQGEIIAGAISASALVRR